MLYKLTLCMTFDAYKDRRLKPLIPALGIPRQVDCQEFEASLGCIGRPCLLHPYSKTTQSSQDLCVALQWLGNSHKCKTVREAKLSSTALASDGVSAKSGLTHAPGAIKALSRYTV